MHFKQETTMKVRDRDVAHSPPSTNPFIHHPFSYIWVLISGATGACLWSPWDPIHFPGLSFWKWHLFFKSGMFYCISFRSIIDWDQTRFQLSNTSPKVSRFKTFCKNYQITGTCQNNQAFKHPEGYSVFWGGGSTCRVLDLWLKTCWRQIFLSILSHNINLLRVWGLLSLNLSAFPFI